MNWKNLTSNKLKSLFQEVEFKTQPYKHQLATLGFTLGKNLKRVMYIHDIGLGKTLTALYTLKLWEVKGKTLIICPNSVIKTWKDEIEKHTDFSYIVVKGSREMRMKTIMFEKTDIYIINYEGLKLIGADKGNNKYVVNSAYPTSFGFECIIADESHKFKNPSSLQTRIAQNFSRKYNSHDWNSYWKFCKGLIWAVFGS